MISRLSKMFKFINLRKERNQTRIENAEGGKAGDKKKAKQSVPSYQYFCLWYLKLELEFYFYIRLNNNLEVNVAQIIILVMFWTG